jgi:hypothetical protein
VTPGRLFAARALSARDAVTQIKRHFLPIYIGLGAPRIANLARAQNVTTVADFVSARYGKSQPVAAIAAPAG